MFSSLCTVLQVNSERLVAIGMGLNHCMARSKPHMQVAIAVPGVLLGTVPSGHISLKVPNVRFSTIVFASVHLC